MQVEDTVSSNDGSDVRRTLAEGVQQATVGAHETIKTVSDAARPAVDRIASNADVVVDKVAGVASHVAESLDAKGEQLRGVEKKLAESMRGYLRDHPLASLGIAVAAGYALSRLLSSR